MARTLPTIQLSLCVPCGPAALISGPVAGHQRGHPRIEKQHRRRRMMPVHAQARGQCAQPRRLAPVVVVARREVLRQIVALLLAGRLLAQSCLARWAHGMLHADGDATALAPRAARGSTGGDRAHASCLVCVLCVCAVSWLVTHFPHDRLTFFLENRGRSGDTWQGAAVDGSGSGSDAYVAERLDHLGSWPASVGRSVSPSGWMRRTSSVMKGLGSARPRWP